MERIDKSLVYAMESAIIDWSHQIQEALKKESSEPLLQGSNPNPKVELEFWKNRCDDLECIYNQLTTRKVRNMMELLERVESSYIPAFKTMLMDVEADQSHLISNSKYCLPSFKFCLQELPEKWNNIKKLAIAVKQHVAPLQADEMTVVRKSCAAFDVEQHRFRERFRKEAPFRFDPKKPYQLLDTKHIEIKQMESAMTSIYESAGLFEVIVPDYKQLKQCRKELCLLKELWDMISLVGTCLDDWQTTKWADINVENMDLECKKFAREIRNLDKEVRAWDAFTGLDSKVKNMLTALKAVAELQNPAIRERHWNQLMQVTGVRFVMDSDTALADLLKLNLHNFEDEVRGIVDKAVREMSMEKVLKELKMTWSTMEFQYEPHPRTNIPLLKSDEELIETLEDNQVQLQNLMTSKCIAFFLEEASIWQRKLSTTDSVISLWFEVQRTWSHLESIFIGSEDIRAQLPKDSKRFEGIDVDFKELAYETQKTPNVVEATNKPGLSQQLEDIQSRLSLCEKALAEYLDMKRLAFPRCYFVSSADLLDILSNGTNPQL
ncbi:dynein axonemal heavy chain 9-like, partial [Patagioenas fasciata]|uniref:dynein axonemal heavy chain 9-like n=1 Tax=Patagioenas fasciata TaxID=372321 RepID=UPI003A990D55